jgi:cytochrome c biogenesis protein CcdA
MLIGLAVFSFFGVGIIGALVIALTSTDKEFTFQSASASFGLFVLSGIFFGLAWVCGYFIKKCFK